MNADTNTFAISDLVAFTNKGKTIHGVVRRRNGRTVTVDVIPDPDNKGRYFRVPQSVLKPRERDAADEIYFAQKAAIVKAYAVGDRVQFTARGGKPIECIVQRANKKTCTVKDANGSGEWRVPFAMLSAVAGTPKAATLPPPPPAADSNGDEPVGATIVKVRKMTKAEMKREGWEPGYHDAAMALVLSNGMVIYASRDFEGNGPGALFASTASGKTIAFCS